jgi:hypothetical protein
MHFPNVPPTADNLSSFAGMLLFDCRAVGFVFRNKVQPPKSEHGRLAVTGTDSDTSVIDQSQFGIQIIGDINNRTLFRVAPKVTEIITKGFEPWYWIAEQLPNHPWNHVMAGPFKPEDKVDVAEMLRQTLPPFVVIVSDEG